jgi:putative acetyltransferase
VNGQPVLCRPELPSDAEAVVGVVAAAFGGPAEARLVEALRHAGALAVSLVALSGGEVVGHVALSPVAVDDLTGGGRWQGLAPLAVLPAHQGRGIGRTLVEAAVAAAARDGVVAVFVLGSSRYYGRLGFQAAAPLGWRCSYEAPEPAFWVRRLGDPALLPPAGTVSYHPAFAEL